MRRIFFAFAGLLLVISACKKNNDGLDLAKVLLIGNWNQVDISTKVPTGKYLKLSEGGGMESTVVTGYNAYEIAENTLIFKNGNSKISNIFVVSSDSLFIQPNILCQDVNGCALLFAKQK